MDMWPGTTPAVCALHCHCAHTTSPPHDTTTATHNRLAGRAAIMSFAEQLKSLKGLMANREQAQAEAARQRAQEEATRQGGVENSECGCE